MSTRYVWDKNYEYGTWDQGSAKIFQGLYSQEFIDNITTVGYICDDIDLVYDEYGVLAGWKAKGSYRALHYGEHIAIQSSSEVFLTSVSETVKAYAGVGYDTNGYWYGLNDSSAGGYRYTAVYKVRNATDTSSAAVDLGVYTLREYKGELVSKVSSPNSNAYPTASGGAVSGGYWYTYLGSDSIDPTDVSYSTNKPKPGDSVMVTVTPRSNTYGGMIYYQYQYSTNDGMSWTDAGAKTSDTSKSITIPAGAMQFRARVLASDNMGFSSTTYVTGENLSLNNAPAAPASVTVPAVVAPGQEFTVSWAASTDPDGNLAGYHLERSYNGGTTWTSVDNAISRTSFDTTVTAGNATVLFRVRAFDSGGLYSGWTVSLSAEINSPPTAPGDIAIGTVTYGDYTELAWTAATDTDGSIAGYVLQRSVNGGSFESVYTGSALSYTDQAENWSWNTVQYRVQAQDDRGGLSDWTVSPQRQVQPGILSIAGDPEAPGQVVKSFIFTASVSASGKFPVSGIQVVITLDGEEKRQTTVSSGGEVSLPISIEDLTPSGHTITVTASRDKFTAATELYDFTIVPIELGAGGLLERLENVQGQPIYPLAILEGIFRKKDGKALEEILSELNGGGGSSDLTIQATAQTLPAGSQATVMVTQTGTDVLLHFSIPAGVQGEQGIQGIQGIQGEQGIQGPEGPAGADGSPGITREDVAQMIQVGAIPAESVKTIQVLTEAEYNALANKPATTLYLIKE